MADRFTIDKCGGVRQKWWGYRGSILRNNIVNTTREMENNNFARAPAPLAFRGKDTPNRYAQGLRKDLWRRLPLRAWVTLDSS